MEAISYYVLKIQIKHVLLKAPKNILLIAWNGVAFNPTNRQTMAELTDLTAKAKEKAHTGNMLINSLAREMLTMHSTRPKSWKKCEKNMQLQVSLRSMITIPGCK